MTGIEEIYIKNKKQKKINLVCDLMKEMNRLQKEYDEKEFKTIFNRMAFAIGKASYLQSRLFEISTMPIKLPKNRMKSTGGVVPPIQENRGLLRVNQDCEIIQV